MRYALRQKERFNILLNKRYFIHINIEIKFDKICGDMEYLKLKKDLLVTPRLWLAQKLIISG